MPPLVRVLIVPEWHPWDDDPGQAPWSREQARAVADHHDVVVIACRGVRSPRRGLWDLTDRVEDGLRTLRLEYRDLGPIYASYPVRLLALHAAMRRLRREGFVPDVIHARVVFSGFASLLLARPIGAPVIVSEHYTAFPRGLVGGVSEAMARITFERAALVCPDSEDLGREIRALGIGGRYRHMPNVVDTSEFRPGPRSARDGVRMVNVASLHEKKGHRFLLEALARARRERSGLSLDLVGDGPLRDELEQLARQLGLGEAVRFHGALAKDGVARRMREADFFVLPSLFENAPHVLIEAMASGLPSVATQVGGIDEMIDFEQGVLVPPGDAPSLAEAMVHMSDSHPRFDADRLARRARERWGHEAVGRLWSEVYEAELSRRRARAATTR